MNESRIMPPGEHLGHTDPGNPCWDLCYPAGGVPGQAVLTIHLHDEQTAVACAGAMSEMWRLAEIHLVRLEHCCREQHPRHWPVGVGRCRSSNERLRLERVIFVDERAVPPDERVATVTRSAPEET